LLAGPPSACSSGENRLDVFAVGAGNTVWRWSWDGTSWTNAPLPSLGAIPVEGVCAVSSGPGRVEVFAAESGSRTPVWWRGNGWTWSPGAALQSVANLPPVPVAAVCASPDSIDVFAAGAGNTPWWWHWNGSWWTAQGSLPGGANIPAVRIAAVSPAPGRLDVFAVGAANHLWHWSRPAGGPSWSLQDLGGNLPAEGVSAVSWGLNRIDVFAASRAAGNPIQHWSWGGGGFVLDELTGNFTPGTVSAVSHAENRLDVFGVTANQQIAHWQWDGRQWIGPAFRGDGIPAGDVSAVVRKGHRLDVFVAGAGNTLRQWPGGGLENATTQPWMNWPTNRVVNPVAGHVRPDSLAELKNVVAEAGRLGRGARAVGSSWSNSEAAVSPAYVVETDGLRSVLTDVLDTSLNAAGSALRDRLVHVEGGIKLYELNDYLDGRSPALALKTMGGSSGQSVAGVVSTSAHGMDIHITDPASGVEVNCGAIPDMVRAIHLVGPGGVEHWLEPSNGITDKANLTKTLGLDPANVHYHDDWFNSVVVSVGSLGIIYSLIVEVVPQYDLNNMCESLDWSAVKDKLKNATAGTDDLFVANRGVQVVINPYAIGASRPCYLTTRTQRAATGPFPGDGTPEWLTGAFTFALLNGMKGNRATIPGLVTTLTAGRQPVGTWSAWGHTIMGGKDPGPVRGYTVEVVFDATNTRYLDFIDSALEIVRKAYADESFGYLGWISLRFQGRSKAYLSPQRGSTRNCTVEFAAAYRIPGPLGVDWPETPVLIGRIEAEARTFGAIQHWAMNDQLNSSDVARAYPRLDTWRRVRWELTKGGTVTTFDSDFTRRCGLSDPPILAPSADYDNDGKADFAVWRPRDGVWYMIDSSTGKSRTQQWGEAGDIPVPGDYDGDGKTDFAVWRPRDGVWYVIESSTGKPHTQQWGEPTDIPVPGDYDGDGKTDFAVWRPRDGVWYVIDSSTGKSRTQQWGQFGDIPVPGRYDADGKTDFAVWRPSTSTWWIIDSSTGAQRSRRLGQEGDIPVPGRYDDDKKTDLAVWRPRTGMWIIDGSKSGKRTQQWGEAGDIPVPGRYDGDAKTDFVVWRPSTGTWFVMDSSTGKTRNQQWGDRGDIPV
jgi:hypothetical protein